MIKMKFNYGNSHIAYIKRYKPFLPLLAILQKPKDVQRFIILAKSCLTCKAYKELNKITCPVFVIGGRQNKVIGGEASEEITEKFGCKIYMYDDFGHAVYEEARDFNGRVYDFLKRQEKINLGNKKISFVSDTVIVLLTYCNTGIRVGRISYGKQMENRNFIHVIAHHGNGVYVV